MNNKSMDEEQSTWYSTYGLVTIERIFGSMKIHLSQEHLHQVSRTPNSPYYQLLTVPLKNIFNGILIHQATDYREYTQKMLVDYLLSGAANLPAEVTKPEGVRLELEMMRTDLIAVGEQFDLLQFEHYRLINDSQGALIDAARSIPKSFKLLDDKLTKKIIAIAEPFMEKSQNINVRVKDFRKQFYQTILSAKDRLDTVADYFNYFEKQPEHLEALQFDAKLGEDREK